MTFRVSLTLGAENDLSDIHGHVAGSSSLPRADALLDQLEELCASLDRLPQRGHFTPELHRLGITDYREVHLRPYRVVYRIDEPEVVIVAILDGRRAIADVLARRLLRS